MTTTKAAPEAQGISIGDRLEIAQLLEQNRAWANRKKRVDPSFFSRLADQQRPRFFWIGCSDSRVPATEIVDLDPGEMFVHRNVANLATAEDQNFAAALQFAVDVLKVEHVIVVGHYGCGGIQAAMQSDGNEAIARWLSPIRSLYRPGYEGREPLSTDADTLCECNVIAQVESLAANAVIRDAWRQHQRPALHGWIYSIADGLLRELYGPIFPDFRTRLADEED